MSFLSPPQGAPAGGRTAATRVVDAAGSGDFTTIAAALADLPAAGGYVYVREGTYTISSTISMPDKPVRLIGSGINNTTIDIGANAIAAITVANAREYAFEGFTISGTSVAGQKAVEVTNASAVCRWQNVASTGILKVFLNTAAGRHTVSNGQFTMPNSLSSVCIDGAGTFELYAVRFTETAAVRGQIINSPDIFAESCRFDLRSGASAIARLVATGCDFDAGNETVTVSGTNSHIHQCTLSNAFTMSGADWSIQGCKFGALNTLSNGPGRFTGNTSFANGRIVISGGGDISVDNNNFSSPGTQAVAIDQTSSGDQANTISTNHFSSEWTTAAIRLAGNRNVVVGNVFRHITGKTFEEVGTANFNTFADNVGITAAGGYTVIGADSVVDETVTVVIAEPISGGFAVAMNSSGRGVVALAGDATKMPAVGVAPVGAASGLVVLTQLDGRLFSTNFNGGSGFSGSLGKVLYVGASGQLTPVAPSASGQIQQRVGASYNASGALIRWDFDTTQVA